MKKILAYLILAVGVYLCSCLTLLIFNLIGVSSIENIFISGVFVALLAGAMMALYTLYKKFIAKQ